MSLNGHNHHNFAMADPALESEPKAPIIGSRPCQITRPMAAPPTHSGRWGRAWAVDLAAARKHLPPNAPPDSTLTHFIVEAPWTSQVVHSYSLIVIHLRFDLHHAPIVRYLAGATHEFALMAIHPMADRDRMLDAPAEMDDWLRPTVFAAQFETTSDEVAVRVVKNVVEKICEGKLSPHPTHARTWALLFGDNMLARRAS